jgi:hypothetical protein
MGTSPDTSSQSIPEQETEFLSRNPTKRKEIQNRQMWNSDEVSEEWFKTRKENSL